MEEYLETQVESPSNDGSIFIEADITQQNEDILTEITIRLHNRFKAKYVLYAVGESETLAELDVKQYGSSDIETEITSRAYREYIINTEIFAIYRGTDDILVEIQPYGFNAIETEIEIRPHNKMWALYEVQQPPIITDIFNPIQDSFTREKASYQSINYGVNSSMVVGKSNDDIWRSFVQFDISGINPSYVLTEAKLRLYYSGQAPSHLNLEVLSADSKWSEFSITHLNRPNPINLISNQFTVGNGYVEFDVFDVVEDWITLAQINNGFIVRVANESVDGQTTFRTRESISPPELVIDYYDSRIFSFGRSQVLTEIEVLYFESSDKATEIEVSSTFELNKLDTEIYVHRKEVPLDSDISVELVISKPTVESVVIVAIPVDSDVLTSISARSEIREEKIDTVIYVSIPEIKAEITAILSDSVELETVIAISKPSVETEITVPNYGENEIDTEIVANDTRFSKILSEINVSKDTAKAELSVRVGGQKDLYTVITATRDSAQTEIEVKYRDEILVEITPNIKSDIQSEIVVSKPIIETEIKVVLSDKDDKETEIFVSYLSQVDTEITAFVYKQIEAEIDVVKTSKVNAEISVTKPRIEVSIVIPTWTEYDLPTTIEPRIIMVDNIETIITVGGKKSAYVFIM